MPSKQEIIKQSKAALGQWEKQWLEHAKIHSRFAMQSNVDLQNTGIGKAALAIATGYSFEKDIETIRENQGLCDIFCVDKSLKSCLENGITPNYVIVCDANVSAEKYLFPVADKLENTTLVVNVCANPKWTANGNWKDIRFFVNRDVLQSEKKFGELSKCPVENWIPAATNVSNALLVFLTQSDDRGARNFFGYDKILMSGYDYCWNDNNYYAFNKNGDGKINYMRNVYCYNLNQDLVYTSTNLLFSSRWMDKYIKSYNLNIFQTSKLSILEGKKYVDNLAEQMRYQYDHGDSASVIDMLNYKSELQKKINDMNAEIIRLGRKHYKQMIRTT